MLETTNNPSVNWRGVYKMGAVAALLQLVSLVLIGIVIAVLGPAPASPEEYFAVMQTDGLVGILRDDFFSLVLIGLYFGTAIGLFARLQRTNFPFAVLGGVMLLTGAVCGFSAHSGFSMLHLSQQYAAAATEAQRVQLLAAGEAVIAGNIWNSSSGYMAGLLLQGGGVILSLVMLGSKDFKKMTALSGLIGNGLDLVQHVIHPFAPSPAAMILNIAGPFYIVWFIMLAWDFYKLGWGVSKVAARKTALA